MPEETRSMKFSPDEMTEVFAKAAGYPVEGTEVELQGDVQEGQFILQRVRVSCTSQVEVWKQVDSRQERRTPVRETVEDAVADDGDIPVEEELPKNFESAVCPYCRETVELDLPPKATVSSPVWCPACGKKDVLGKFRQLRNSVLSARKTDPSVLKNAREEAEKENLKNQMEALGL